MSLGRRSIDLPDILEWARAERGPLRFLRKERYKLEKGFVSYFNDAAAFFSRSSEADKTNEVPTSTQTNAARSMDQYNESQDLIKRMKWKRVTWDENANYTMFSKRIMENDALFSRTSAFSFMSIHVVKDPRVSPLVVAPAAVPLIDEGALTNWVLRERDPKEVGMYRSEGKTSWPNAVTVDWQSGEVKILDSASAQEVLTFLSTVAPRLQKLQMDMEEQQTRLTDDIEKVRVRVGAVLKFNAFDSTYWDDPKRKTDPNYVNPADVEYFLKAMLKSAFLYRSYFKGQQIRIVPAGKTYSTDMENKELLIPANFADYSWLNAHRVAERRESVFDGFRRFWWAWYLLGLILIGDVELL